MNVSNLQGLGAACVSYWINTSVLQETRTISNVETFNESASFVDKCGLILNVKLIIHIYISIFCMKKIEVFRLIYWGKNDL